MPRVVIAGIAARRFTGGLSEFEVEANTVRRMITELDRRFPGLGHQIDEGMAVAIDGEIFQDACFAPAQPRKRDLSDPQDRRRLTAPLGPDHSSGTPSLRRPAK